MLAKGLKGLWCLCVWPREEVPLAVNVELAVSVLLGAGFPLFPNPEFKKQTDTCPQSQVST